MFALHHAGNRLRPNEVECTATASIRVSGSGLKARHVANSKAIFRMMSKWSCLKATCETGGSLCWICIKPHGIEGRHKDGGQYIRWHFADREIAESFAAKFAKERTNVMQHHRGNCLKEAECTGSLGSVENLDKSQELESSRCNSRY